MNVVVENGSYHMDNLGDVAMLQVCVRRIRARWPDARIRVVNETPDRLSDAVPGVEALSPAQEHRTPMTKRTRHPWVRGLEREIQLRAPSVAHWAKRRQVAWSESRVRRYDAFQDALKSADAVVCSGGGYVNDCHPEHAEKVFHTLGIAQAYGRPTAMFGAGLGPLTESRPLALATRVVDGLRVLGLREGEGNLGELEAWGCKPPHIFVTGDDAIVLAREEAGNEASVPERGALGVSLRVAREYGEQDAAGLDDAVRRFRERRGAPVIGLPVRTRLSPDNDVDALRALLGDAAPDLSETAAVGTPRELIRRVGGCRVVLTGTYHAGVFALSLGIPVVTLSGSAYYDRKFAGLAEQFGGSAVRSLRYDDPALASKVLRSLHELWESASSVTASLVEAADAQIDKGRWAYDAFFRLVEDGAGGGRRAT